MGSRRRSTRRRWTATCAPLRSTSSFAARRTRPGGGVWCVESAGMRLAAGKRKGATTTRTTSTVGFGRTGRREHPLPETEVEKKHCSESKIAKKKKKKKNCGKRKIEKKKKKKKKK